MGKNKGDKIIDEVWAEANAIDEAKNQPMTVKVSTLVKIGVAIIAIAIVFFIGWKANDMHENSYNAIRNSAVKAYVQSLK